MNADNSAAFERKADFVPSKRVILHAQRSKKVARTVAQMGICLFEAGFKDITKAASLLPAINFLSPLDGVVFEEKADRITISFTFLRRIGIELKKGEPLDDSSDDMLVKLFAKIRMCASACQIEYIQGPDYGVSYVRIVLAKTAILAIIDPRSSVVAYSKSNWSEVQTPSDVLPENYAALSQAQRSLYEAELFLVKAAKLRSSRSDIIAIDEYWRYNRAVLQEDSRAWSAGSQLSKLAGAYPKVLHPRWRFLVTHLYSGGVQVEVLRKQSLD